MKLDAFVKVKKAIDDMVAALKTEMADEVKHRDFCIDALNTNESETNEKNRDAKDLRAQIEELTGKINQLTAAIKALEADNAEMRVQMKRAGEDREKENLEFQKTVQEQRATQALLTKAMDVLKGFYEKKTGGGGVIAMITQIVNDAKAMEAEAVHDEEDAQKAYESFVQETNASIDANNKNIVNKKESRATAEGDKAQAETDLDNTNTDLAMLANENADLHKSCDFTLKNFEINQEARGQEIDALGQ